MGWGNSRVASALSRQLAAMTWCVICGKGSHIDHHAVREIALGIARRICPWWNPRGRDRGELQLHEEGLQMATWMDRGMPPGVLPLGEFGTQLTQRRMRVAEIREGRENRNG
jgi:hypothetical protein